MCRKRVNLLSEKNVPLERRQLLLSTTALISFLLLSPVVADSIVIDQHDKEGLEENVTRVGNITTTEKKFQKSQYDDSLSKCSNGALVAEGAVPGAYQQECMNLPERTLTLKGATGDTLIIYQGASTTSVAGRTGVAIWNSGLLLVRLLDALYQATNGTVFRDKAVVELGCGTAIASIAIAKLGGSVLATDGNVEVLTLAKRNMERNGVLTNGGGVAQLQWGLLDASDFSDSADIIIGSDLTYNSGSWRMLAETMGAVLKPNGFVLYVTIGHSGFGTEGELDGFLTVADNEGLVKEDEYDWPGITISLSMLLSESLNEQERAVVGSTGGARVILLRKKALGNNERYRKTFSH